MTARRLVWTVALLWLVGLTLRITVLAVPPVIPAIQSELGLSGTEVGILGGLPVVLFALAAVPGSLLIARFGALETIVVGLLIAALGTMLRGALPDVGVLFAATALMAAGLAVLQPALPVLVREWLPDRIGFATSVYANGLLVGELVPVAFTLTVMMPLFGGSWQWATGIWALPLVVVAALAWTSGVRSAPQSARPVELPRWRPDWRDPLTWRLGFIFGGITSYYFAVNSFLPSYLSAAGREDLISPALTALNFMQIPASLLLLVFARKLERRAWPLTATGIFVLACIAGTVLTAGLGTVVLAGLIGFLCAVGLVLGLTLPPLVCAPADVARTAGGMFAIAYTFAVAISVLSGLAWDLTGNVAYAFLPIALGSLPVILLPAKIPFRG